MEVLRVDLRGQECSRCASMDILAKLSPHALPHGTILRGHTLSCFSTQQAEMTTWQSGLKHVTARKVHSSPQCCLAQWYKCSLSCFLTMLRASASLSPIGKYNESSWRREEICIEDYSELNRAKGNNNNTYWNEVE